MGFTVVRLHYSADPFKDPQNPDPKTAELALRWLETQRRIYPDPNEWEREMEINFHVGKGRRVFPQFTEIVHAPNTLEYNRRKKIYRSWDFGWHAPVCLFAQVGPKDRLNMLFEVVGSQVSTKEFAQKVIDVTHRLYPNHAAGFQDYCDPAGQYVKSIESEKNEKRDLEVLESFGIFPSYEFGWSRKDGRALVHQILGLRTDNTPGMCIDPEGCPLLLRAFLGAYIYKETKDGRIHDDPDDETHPWADLMAAMRYLVTGVHRILIPHYFKSNIFTPTETPAFHGYGTPLPNKAIG